MEIQSVNLSGIARQVVSRFEPIFEHEEYTFKLSIEPDQYVMGDEQKLTQVLYILIGNATNYIGEDKTIAVTVAGLGGRARFEVTDHGGGIPEEELSMIWDRYYKAKEHR